MRRIPTATSFLEVRHDNTKIIESCRDSLLSLYRLYCGVDNSRCTDNQMTGSKWHKLLKDAGLLQEDHQYSVPHSEIDLIFAKA